MRKKIFLKKKLKQLLFLEKKLLRQKIFFWKNNFILKKTLFFGEKYFFLKKKFYLWYINVFAPKSPCLKGLGELSAEPKRPVPKRPCLKFVDGLVADALSTRPLIVRQTLKVNEKLIVKLNYWVSASLASLEFETIILRRGDSIKLLSNEVGL